MIVKKSFELNIDLNSQDASGRTTFLFACMFGKSGMVHFLMEKSFMANIDLNMKDHHGRIGFQPVCLVTISQQLCSCINLTSLR